MEPPALSDFLALPAEEVAAVAPATMIFAPGGTRRSAVLAGLDPHSDTYAAWSRRRMLGCLERIFRLGVRHIFTVVLRPAQMAEVGRYRERLLSWLTDGLAGPEALDDYTRRGWRARLAGTLEEPILAAAAATLRGQPAPDNAPTAWFYVTASPAEHHALLRRALCAPEGETQAGAALALYGEEVPPATLMLSFGKPLVGDDLLPLFICGEVQCYWSQRPGFELDDEGLRRIFYDYAYTRRTWRQDKGGRYEHVIDQRDLWGRNPALVLGEGRRLAGGLWYPREE